MGKIDKNIINRIKAAAKIEEVVGDFVDLKKKGPRYVGLCPFHDDKHIGNFSVYPRKNIFYCFACEAKGGPVEFLMRHEGLSFPDAIRWLGKKYNIETDCEPFNWTPKPRQELPKLEILTLPMSIVSKYEQLHEDNLVNWINNNILWDAAQRARINGVLSDYHIGHGTMYDTRWDGTRLRNDYTIFWQIDEQGRVRTGKMMKYRTDGHRDKESPHSYDWVHSTLSRKLNNQSAWPYPHLFNPDKQECVPCIFGMHLLDKFPNATVCIVESEKTAILMAIAYGNHHNQLWMACGGKNNINRDKLKAILRQERKIILYPDRDGIQDWKIKTEQLHYNYAYVDEEPVTKWWIPEDGEKADIADVVIRMINKQSG